MVPTKYLINHNGIRNYFIGAASWSLWPMSSMRGARGTLVALSGSTRDERPLVAYGGQVRGRGVSNARQVRPVRSSGKARCLHVLLPVCAHAEDTCVTFMSE